MKLKNKLLPIVAIAASAAIALPTIASCTTENGGGGEGGGEHFDPITLSYAFTLQPNPETGGTEVTPYEPDIRYQQYVIPDGRLGENPSLEEMQDAYFEIIAEHPGILADDLIHEFSIYANELYVTYLYSRFYGRFEVTVYDFDAETGLATLSIFHKYYAAPLIGDPVSYINYVYCSNVQLALIRNTYTQNFYLAYAGVDPDEISESTDRDDTAAAAEADQRWQMSWTFVDLLDEQYYFQPYYMYWDFLNVRREFVVIPDSPSGADCFATWAKYGRLPYHLRNYWPE